MNDLLQFTPFTKRLAPRVSVGRLHVSREGLVPPEPMRAQPPVGASGISGVCF